MNRRRFSPDDLRVASPCTASWEAMPGDERKRLCAQCNLHVYDVAELTRAEVAALAAQSEGRLCLRLHRRADGTVLTRDCPAGLRAARRRVARRAGAALAALLGLCGVSVFGKTLGRVDGAASTAAAALTLRRGPSQSRHGVFSGVVKDRNGAVIDGASVTLTDEKTKRKLTTKTDDDGAFSFLVERGGRFAVEVELPGFRKFTAEHVGLSADETAWADIDVTLEVAMIGEVIVTDYEDRTPVKTRGPNTVLAVDALRGVRPRD